MDRRLKAAFDKYAQNYKQKSGFEITPEDAFEAGYMICSQAGALAYNAKLHSSAIEDATQDIIESFNEGPIS